MIGGRAKQILKNAKPIAKYNSQASNSIPAPPQPPPTPSVPTFSPPSPTPRSPPPAPHKANPTLLLSTLHKNPSFSSEPRDDSVFNNTSNGSSYGSNKSNIMVVFNFWRERAAFQRLAFGRLTAGNDQKTYLAKVA